MGHFRANLSPFIPGPPGGFLPGQLSLTFISPRGRIKPVFDKNRTHLEALHKALPSVLDWQSEADS